MSEVHYTTHRGETQAPSEIELWAHSDEQPDIRLFPVSDAAWARLAHYWSREARARQPLALDGRPDDRLIWPGLTFAVLAEDRAKLLGSEWGMAMDSALVTPVEVTRFVKASGP